MKCENCGKAHNRKRFCSNKCKDRYHNKRNPRGIAACAVTTNDGHEASDIEEMAGAGYAAGWDEDGWRDDDSGVSAF